MHRRRTAVASWLVAATLTGGSSVLAAGAGAQAFVTSQATVLGRGIPSDEITLHDGAAVAKSAEVALKFVFWPFDGPETILHEYSHALAFRAFGAHPKVDLHESWPWVVSSKPYAGATIVAASDWVPTAARHPWKDVVVQLAPVGMDLLVRDRLLEIGLRDRTGHRSELQRVGVDWFSGLELDQLGGLFESATGTDGDVARAAARLHVNKWVLATVLQGAYAYSAVRVVRSARMTSLFVSLR